MDVSQCQQQGCAVGKQVVRTGAPNFLLDEIFMWHHNLITKNVQLK